MKNSIARRIAVLVLALSMVLTMGISVFAAGQSGGTEDSKATLGPDKNMITKPTDKTNEDISKSGVRQNGTDITEGSPAESTHGEYVAVENTVRLYKEIIIFNTNSADTLVYLPNITYSYAVTAVDVADEKYITDEYGLTATIQDGVEAAIKTQPNDVVFSSSGITPTKTDPNPGYVITNQNGKEARGYLDIEFDPTQFTKPGVYRYAITETANDRAAAGVTIDKDKYGDKRYLDVYVQNHTPADASDTQKFEIYGYALYQDGTNKDAEFDATGSLPITAKTNGFVSKKFDTKETTYSRSEKDVDIYDTANIKIEKKITGAMGDKNHKFPFEATIKNANITANAKFSYQVVESGGTLNTTSTSNPTKELNASVKIGAADATGADSFKLKDTEYIYIYGVPGKSDVARSVDNVVTKVEVKEFNDTTDTYNVTAKYNTSDVNVTNKKTPKATVAAVAEQEVPFTQTEEYMVVTNNMHAISPTNVVMRFAPYLLILGGAILLLMVSRRRKSEQE